MNAIQIVRILNLSRITTAEFDEDIERMRQVDGMLGQADIESRLQKSTWQSHGKTSQSILWEQGA